MTNRFEAYIQKGIEELNRMDYTKFPAGYWEREDITQYYAGLPNERYNQFLTSSISHRMAKKGSLLIFGGAVGRLGRNIALNFPGIKVTEIDNSKSMSCLANKLAFRQGLKGRFKSLCVDANNSGLNNNTFDHVAASGFIRYFRLDQQLYLISEMRRISKGGVTIVEGRTKELMYTLKDKFGDQSKISTFEIEMLNMSLFFNLLKKYNGCINFKRAVDKGRGEQSFLDFLVTLSGSSRKSLYELVINPV